MNKLLKLTGVSILAFMVANGANAAGYTCEELIEYTSCNTGRALVDGDCVCDAGYYTNGDACTVCPIGSYSSVNATQCTTCPATGLVNPDDEPILATTAGTGSDSITACIVPTGVTIKGEAGLYHFKSSCAYNAHFDASTATYEEKVARCGDLGGHWNEEYHYCFAGDDACEQMGGLTETEEPYCVFLADSETECLEGAEWYPDDYLNEELGMESFCECELKYDLTTGKSACLL